MGPKKAPMLSLAMNANERLADTSSGVRPALEPRPSAVVAQERSARLRRMVDEHIDFVSGVRVRFHSRAAFRCVAESRHD